MKNFLPASNRPPSSWFHFARGGLVALALLASAGAAPVFTQDFESSSDINTYRNGANPTTSQFNGILTGGADFAWAIANSGSSNVLQGTRSNPPAGGSSGALVRSTDLATTGQAVSFQFNFNMSAITSGSASTTDIAFQVGSGYTNITGAESGATFGQFFFDLQSTTQYAVTGSANLGGSSALLAVGTNYLVTFLVNRSPTTVSYLAPDGTTQSLNSGSESLYLDNVRYINNQAVGVVGGNSSNDVTDFKLRFASDFGTIQADNFNINVVPEPATIVWLAGGSVAALGLVRRRRSAGERA